MDRVGLSGSVLAEPAQSASGLGIIGRPPACKDGLQVFFMLRRPMTEHTNRFVYPTAECGEAILGLWRHDRVDLAVDDAVTLQASKDLDEHLFRDVGDLMLQFGEAPGAAREAIEDYWCPLVRDEIEELARWIASVVNGCQFLGHAP